MLFDKPPSTIVIANKILECGMVEVMTLRLRH